MKDRSRTGPVHPLLALLVVAAAALGMGLLQPALAQGAGDDEAPCGIPPPAKPRRIKGGEGFPPLPLPVTPLRRSERKRDPAPPTLIGKVIWGRRDLIWRTSDGREKHYGDWNNDPNDIPRLLKNASRELQAKYRVENIDLGFFSYDPAELPILYAAGLKPFTLTDGQRDQLRRYLLAGGMLFGVAHHGSKTFSSSFRKEMALLFPDRPFRLLPPDHPIYRAHRPLKTVSYSPGTRDRPERGPYIEGLYIGCRVAAVLSPYDLCCAWDSDHLPNKYPGVHGSDAFTIGYNVISYALAYHRLGQFYGRSGLVELSDQKADRGDFVFAQVHHRGHYDPHPTAFANLLSVIMKETSVGARFQRRTIALSDPELRQYPFVYLTGHGELRLSGEEVSGLRAFLQRGGFLLADACCGDLAFDVSFRRELARILPETRLQELPPDHPVFSSFYRIKDVKYTTAVRANFPSLNGPFLEGVEIGGALRVAYSRFDIGNGWEGEEHPFALGLLPDSARRLGVNIIIYSMTN